MYSTNGINLYEIACKMLARGLQLACERLAEDESSEARKAFKRYVSCLHKACKWLAEAHKLELRQGLRKI